MKNIVISSSTMALLASCARYEFSPQGTQLKSGDWRVPIGDDTYERLQSLRHDVETIEDVLVRVCSFSKNPHKH